MRKYLPIYIALIFCIGFVNTVQAQGLFEKSTFKKVENTDASTFDRRFDGMIWTGQGFNRQVSVIDNLPTTELRARLQQVFGAPTKTVKDLIEEKKFGRSEGATIQFEYRFVVNDSIPVMLLDINGPFGQGLVWVGGNRWVDRLAQIKRDMTEQLMGTKTLAPFKDYFYSPEQEQWFVVQLADGQFKTEKLTKSPF